MTKKNVIVVFVTGFVVLITAEEKNAPEWIVGTAPSELVSLRTPVTQEVRPDKARLMSTGMTSPLLRRVIVTERMNKTSNRLTPYRSSDETEDPNIRDFLVSFSHKMSWTIFRLTVITVFL